MTNGTIRQDNLGCESELSKKAMEVLLDLITPYYKSFPEPGHEPEFRKSLSGEEITNVLSGVHNVITEILIEGVK